MSLVRLFTAYFRISVISEAAYRANFFVQLFQSFLNLGISLAGLGIIFSYTDSLGGWRPDEVLALVGVYFLVAGMVGLIIQPALEKFIESVRLGTLDFVLTKPEDSQLMISLQRVEIWQLIDLAMGFGVLTFALLRLGENIGWSEAGAFILMLLSGAVIIYSFLLILATLSFWLVRVENILVIFQSVYEAGRWPISLYPGWLRYSLTFVVPVAFATSVPAQAITGRLNWQTLLGAVALAAASLVVSRIFWRFGLGHYTGASS